MQHSTGRPKGHPKAGGRTKGTPNKVTSDFRLRLEESGFDPISAAISLFEDEDTPHDIKFKCVYFLTEFSYYKPKNPLDIPGNLLPPAPVDNYRLLSDEDLDDAINCSVKAKKI